MRTFIAIVCLVVSVILVYYLYRKGLDKGISIKIRITIFVVGIIILFFGLFNFMLHGDIIPDFSKFE